MVCVAAKGACQWRVLVTLLFSIVMIILFDCYFVLGLLVVGLVCLEADWVVLLGGGREKGVSGWVKKGIRGGGQGGVLQ